MTPKEAREARQKVADKKKQAAAAKTASDKETKPPDEETTLPPHEVPPVEVMPDCSAQVSSVVGGAVGQAWGLPRPVSQKEYDDQAAMGTPKEEAPEKEARAAA